MSKDKYSEVNKYFGIEPLKRWLVFAGTHFWRGRPIVQQTYAVWL